MTEKQKSELIALRNDGFGYKKIAKATGLSENTVSSFCRRHGVGTNQNGAALGKTAVCKNCGAIVIIRPGVKPKQFCSDKCRNAWWNARQDEVSRKAYYNIVCSHCGGTFVSYGNRNRKYCSHACYVAERFGKGDAFDAR